MADRLGTGCNQQSTIYYLCSKICDEGLTVRAKRILPAGRKHFSNQVSTMANKLVLLLFLVSSLLLEPVGGMSRCSQYALASASIPRHYGTHRPGSITPSRSRRRPFRYDSYADDSLSRTLPVARTKKSKKASHENDDSKISSVQEAIETPMTAEEMYASLGPVGKTVAGTVEIAVSTLTEYITGFVGGYVLGSITDVPRFMFKTVDNTQTFPFFQEMAKRYGRMHSKSLRWAKTWGGISAAFGGFRVATKVVRGGKEDEWNTILTSAAAGAFFARNGRDGLRAYF
jgi:hypothetical protein